ncbi:sulfotransferase 1A1-like [Colias croceus]|uniref:sulfotransferase 1A1-like n=1 Tax=Colias crocea TaxID=72248 RepID=UPI001E27B14C|nr:sulfotransferase 1A1-like [Colias croceus]
MSTESNLPVIEDVDKKILEEIISCTQKTQSFVYVGPKRYFYPDSYKTFGPQIYNFAVRPDDVFLLAYPRTGSTWTQEMLWLLNNNLDYKQAKSVDMDTRFPLIDYCLTLTSESEKDILDNIDDVDKREFLKSVLEPGVNKLRDAPSPRFIKSHLPLSLLPPNLLDTTKVVYLIRDPRDVMVSYYNISKLRFLKPGVEFSVFWSLLRRGLVSWSPIFAHLKEAWEKRHHPNMLFIFYEDLSKDLAGCLKRMAKFYGKSYSEEQIEELCEHLKFENFKKNDAVNQSKVLQDLGVIADGETAFIRKGKVGGWRDYFQGEMETEVENWMKENLADTDFKFPTFNPHIE